MVDCFVCRLFSVLLVILCFVLGTVAQDNIPEQAAQAMVINDYDTAIVLYQDALQTNPRDANLYFNLGTAHFRAGSYGAALVSFRRAQQFIPRDPALNLAISSIQSQRVDVQGDAINPLDRLVDVSSTVVTLQELIGAGLLLWLSVGGVVGVMILFPAWRDILLPLLQVLVVVLFAVLLFVAGRWYVSEYRPQAVVQANVTLYSGPDTDYLRLYDLAPAAELRVIRQEGEWGQAVLPGGRQGWVQVSQLEFVRLPGS